MRSRGIIIPSGHDVAQVALRHCQGLEVITRICERFACVGYLQQSYFVRDIHHDVLSIKPLQQAVAQRGIFASARRILSGEDISAVVESFGGVLQKHLQDVSQEVDVVVEHYRFPFSYRSRALLQDESRYRILES
jgi:hypothetical protein